jgi:CheY-specific phosphatase CheX
MLAKLVAAQAQNYLDNPSTSVLLTLQNQVLTFQQQINTSILQAAKITNMQSQQRVLAAIEGLSTAVTAVIALIATVKGNTLSTASLTAPVKIAQVISPQQIDVSTQMVAEHYGITTGAAEASVRASIYALRRIGL